VSSASASERPERPCLGVDLGGILSEGMPDLTPAQRAYAIATNPKRVTGGLREALIGADVFIGTSVGGALDPDLVRLMAASPVVFALANPEPEVQPEAIEDRVAVIATGRSDYPNQINNVLCFPGFFRGLLDSGAGQITDAMKLAAAHAIADVVGDDLNPEYIIPSVFNRNVAPAVAAAVSGEARSSGLAREDTDLIDPLHVAGAGRDLAP
jgi:malate dehydrogenase (oxaloacetate-decarboxylating)